MSYMGPKSKKDRKLIKEKKEIKTIKVKTLCSDLYTDKKDFKSIFKCKEKQKQKNPFLISSKNEIRIQSGVYGPLIVIHRDLNEKILPKKHKKFNDEFGPIKPYTYFQQHAKCPETQYYWHDLLHPKILRHYSPKRSKSIVDKRELNAYL